MIILLIIQLLILTLFIYFYYRNDKVLQFSFMIIDMCHEYAVRHNYALDAYDWFDGKHSYEKMLFSFKPLTLEAWFTKEELDKINS